jgi:G3E family GTPase
MVPAMIPITLVTGFLGAGKTSLIAHLLDSVADRSVAVIVNDMAPRSIDGAYLRGGEHLPVEKDDLIRTISGGRVGAGKRDELVADILEIAKSHPHLDAILVETSGGSPALALAAALETSPELTGLVYVDTVITVVDTDTIATWWGDSLLRPVITDQLAAADLIILNKHDRAGLLSRFRARSIIKAVNRSVRTVTATFGQLPPEEIIRTGRRAAGDPALRGGESNPNHYPLVSRHLEERRPLHPERLDQWLNEDWPGIVRIKGFLWIATDMEHLYAVDAAGPQRELGLEGTWYGALQPEDLPDSPAVRAVLSEGPYQDRRQSITVIGIPEAVEREMRNIRSVLLSVTEMDRGPAAWATLPDPIRPQFERENERENEQDSVQSRTD